MKRYFVLYGLSVAALLTPVTAHAQDDITTTKNEDGTWSFVKPADLDVELEVVYFTQKELDSMAQPVKLNSTPSPMVNDDSEADDDEEEEVEELDVTLTSEKALTKKDSKVKKKTTKKKRNRHKRSRRRTRRR